MTRTTSVREASFHCGCAISSRSCPAAQKIRTATFSGVTADPGKQKLKMRIMFPSDALTSGAYDPLRLIVTDLGAGGATLYDITLPDGVTAFQHACDPRDRWTGSGYVNKSNALPPDCIPGSAQGFLEQEFDLRVHAAQLVGCPALERGVQLGVDA